MRKHAHTTNKIKQFEFVTFLGEKINTKTESRTYRCLRSIQTPVVSFLQQPFVVLEIPMSPLHFHSRRLCSSQFQVLVFTCVSALVVNNVNVIDVSVPETVTPLKYYSFFITYYHCIAVLTKPGWCCFKVFFYQQI